MILHYAVSCYLKRNYSYKSNNVKEWIFAGFLKFKIIYE